MKWENSQSEKGEEIMETLKMKVLVLIMFCGFSWSLMPQSFSHDVRAANVEARMKIDIDRTIGEINKNLYGNFVEHLGRCVYGGIFEPDSEQADEKGFRKDVLEAVKGLNVSIARYPGGNFVSNYHWLDGVGPERTPRMELAWARLETNKFGTNEFMEFARAIGTEPYFAVNMGTGTIEEAQRWVEYCRKTGYRGVRRRLYLFISSAFLHTHKRNDQAINAKPRPKAPRSAPEKACCSEAMCRKDLR